MHEDQLCQPVTKAAAAGHYKETVERGVNEDFGLLETSFWETGMSSGANQGRSLLSSSIETNPTTTGEAITNVSTRKRAAASSDGPPKKRTAQGCCDTHLRGDTRLRRGHAKQKDGCCGCAYSPVFLLPDEDDFVNPFETDVDLLEANSTMKEGRFPQKEPAVEKGAVDSGYSLGSHAKTSSLEAFLRNPARIKSMELPYFGRTLGDPIIVDAARILSNVSDESKAAAEDMSLYEYSGQELVSPVSNAPVVSQRAGGIITRRNFSWEQYPELEQFLATNRDEYEQFLAAEREEYEQVLAAYEQSSLVATDRHEFDFHYWSTHTKYIDRLTGRLMEVAALHNFVFHPNDFDFAAIRDQIRCYYRTNISTEEPQKEETMNPTGVDELSRVLADESPPAFKHGGLESVKASSPTENNGSAQSSVHPIKKQRKVRSIQKSDINGLTSRIEMAALRSIRLRVRRKQSDRKADLYEYFKEKSEGFTLTFEHD